jgi:hypothetical protein
VLGLSHDRLVGEGRVAALHPDVVGIQRISRPGIEKPRMRRLPHQEQVVVALDSRESTAEIRPDAGLRVLLGKHSELARDEDTVTRVEMAVNIVRELLAECMHDGVPRDVVRVADVVHLQLPVNLKECRSLFSAANEIHLELTGEKVGAYEGLDGVFKGIWTALETYPEWTVLILDEIDHIRHDSNYDPNDFFCRLLRGEGKFKRDLNLSVFLISNELLAVDLRLDSRVQSAMDGEEVFFPPYGVELLEAILRPRIERAFREGAVSDSVFAYGVREAARRWGDVRKALRLFRQAGETATGRGLEAVTRECLDANIETTDKDDGEAAVGAA